MKKLRLLVPVSVVAALVLLLMAPAGALAAPSQGAKRGGCEEWYRVRRGDTLARIARVHGTSVWELVEINDIEDPDLIFAGTTLCVDSDNGGRKGDDNGWKGDDNGRRKADDNGGWKGDDNGRRKGDDNGNRKGDCSGGRKGQCGGWNSNWYPYWSGTWNDGWNDGWNGN